MRVVASAVLVLLLAACGATSSVGSVTPPPATLSVTPSSTAQTCLALQGGTASRATIADVRVGTHAGYDRVVVEFTGGMPAYKLAWQDPATFVGPASGIPIRVAGSAGMHLFIYGMDIPPAYQHGTNMSPNYTALKQVVVLGVFEGQADIAIGLARPACPTVTWMTNPFRLVIDFAT